MEHTVIFAHNYASESSNFLKNSIRIDHLQTNQNLAPFTLYERVLRIS